MTRLRFRLARILARLAAILSAAGCSPPCRVAILCDPVGPATVTCGPGMEHGAGNGCYAVEGARVRDAESDAP